MTTKTPAKNSITSKIEQLSTAVEWFYGDEFQLDQASTKYQQAVKLADEIEKDLGQLKNQIEVIDKDFTKA